MTVVLSEGLRGWDEEAPAGIARTMTAWVKTYEDGHIQEFVMICGGDSLTTCAGHSRTLVHLEICQ
jgi:hypothetical protein